MGLRVRHVLACPKVWSSSLHGEKGRKQEEARGKNMEGIDKMTSVGDLGHLVQLKKLQYMPCGERSCRHKEEE